MTENENEKKPEEGEAAAPESATPAPESSTAAPENAEAAPEETGAAPETAEAASAEPSGDQPAPWVARPFDQPDPGAGSEATGETVPPAEPVQPDSAGSGEGDATGQDESTFFAWATQPFDQPDPGAGAEAAPEAPAAPEEEPAAASEPQPLRVYEYRFVRVKQNCWDAVEAAVLGTGAAAVADAGGQLYGVWAGQIGLSANQGIVVTVWADLDAAKRHGKAAIEGIDDVSASETLYLEPTARPLDATAPEGPGMFAHRIFEVRKDDCDRFVALSDEAWPQFEDVFGAKVFALWRETGHDRAFDRLILLTRYPDYAAWEKSRYWRPEPDPNAADALARFRERREITVDTVVYTTRLCAAAGG